jgi:hypothetical protein
MDKFQRALNEALEEINRNIEESLGNTEKNSLRIPSKVKVATIEINKTIFKLEFGIDLDLQVLEAIEKTYKRDFFDICKSNGLDIAMSIYSFAEFNQGIAKYYSENNDKEPKDE